MRTTLNKTVTKRLLALGVALVVAAPAATQGHEERPVKFPSGKGSIPKYRTTGPRLLVCNSTSARRIATLPASHESRNRALLAECERDGYETIQAAVDGVKRQGSRIMILPGTYYEVPSLTPAVGMCKDLKDKEGPLSYKEELACPNLINLVAVLGDGLDKGIACDRERLCHLQIEGTGAKPTDVIIDARWKKHNALRGDRADGIYVRNLTVQHAVDNALYIMQTDGFVADRIVGRWTDDYGILTFATDHGLYKNCETYGNSDAGVYPGSAAPWHGARYSTEIRNCRSHHNALGYSGTAGNSVYAHHNSFYNNITGVTMDSLFPNHPGLPQNSAVFVNNRIYSNNEDYYRYIRNGTCDKPLEKRRDGVICPHPPAPIGVGLLTAGGNANVFARNWIYDNWRYGYMLFWAPALLRGEYSGQQYDTSHFNRYVSNWMGLSPTGGSFPNGLDFWWDEEGSGNCWENNIPIKERGITSDPQSLPNCDQTPTFSQGNSIKHAQLAPCATYNREDNPEPPGCDFMTKPERPD
jgi:hypothetical protein